MQPLCQWKMQIISYQINCDYFEILRTEARLALSGHRMYDKFIVIQAVWWTDWLTGTALRIRKHPSVLRVWVCGGGGSFTTKEWLFGTQLSIWWFRRVNKGGLNESSPSLEYMQNSASNLEVSYWLFPLAIIAASECGQRQRSWRTENSCCHWTRNSNQRLIFPRKRMWHGEPSRRELYGVKHRNKRVGRHWCRGRSWNHVRKRGQS